MYSKSEFLEEIKKGLYESWLFTFSTNDTPYISMKPEYLTTIILGKHLVDDFSTRFSGDNYIVRFEEQTKDVATRAFPVMPRPYKPHNVHGRAKKESGEEGSVDLTIYQQKSYIPETVAIIEVKNFDQRDELLIKDLDRNKEFMELSESGKKNQIKFAFLTFFLHDKDSRVKEEAESFILSKRQHYQEITNCYCSNEICATLTIDSLVNFPVLTDSTATELDENGQQIVETEENHHIVYGIICLSRKI